MRQFDCCIGPFAALRVMVPFAEEFADVVMKYGPRRFLMQVKTLLIKMSCN